MAEQGGRELLVSAEDVGKRFGDFIALHPLNVKVHSGEFFGVFGPNGAGKSTLVRSILGLVRLASGQARVFGHDPYRKPRRVRQIVGVVPEDECVRHCSSSKSLWVLS